MKKSSYFLVFLTFTGILTAQNINNIAEQRIIPKEEDLAETEKRKMEEYVQELKLQREQHKKQHKALSDAAIKAAASQAEIHLIQQLLSPAVALTPGDIIELKKAISYLIKAQDELKLTRNAQIVFDTILEQTARINKAGMNPERIIDPSSKASLMFMIEDRQARSNELVWEPEALSFLDKAFEILREHAFKVEQKRGVPRQQKYIDENIFQEELAVLDS